MTGFLTMLVLASPAVCQVAAKDQLVGWSTVTPVTAAGQIDMQDIDGGCKAARRVCASVLKGNANAFHAGGTAWDGGRGAVWVSDGSTIAVVGLPGCRVQCQFRAQTMLAGGVVTGLAYSDVKRRLFQLESKQGTVALRSYDTRTCPPAPLRDGCTFKIQSNATAAGLAYDEVRDLLYVSESFPAFVGWLSNLHIARAGNKCVPVCKLPLKSCGSGAQGWGAISGLAYSTCNNRLYATDGRLTSISLMTSPLACRVTHVGCCKRQTAGSYRGLAVVPGWKQRGIGKSCLAASCTSCPSMTARLAGAPSIGNAAFGFDVAGGPGGRFALVVLGAGCGQGLKLPFLCQPLYPSLVPGPLLSAPVQLTGSGCLGAAHAPLPLPLDRGFCGLQLCAQWLVLCGPVFGTTGAIEFTIAGT